MSDHTDSAHYESSPHEEALTYQHQVMAALYQIKHPTEKDREMITMGNRLQDELAKVYQAELGELIDEETVEQTMKRITDKRRAMLDRLRDYDK